MNKKSKLIHSIKGKLISATCMLLVAMIMVVSSTYAWFTLSTAPEVTGIQTAVGANGALEIALLPKSGATADIKSEVGDSIKDDEGRNITWGNLVDLSDNTIYGLDKIVLNPSSLNVTDGTNIIGEAPLKTPAYGDDGRVSELKENTVFGIFDKTNSTFPVAQDTDRGVRAVGVASGMTPRQLDYRNARSAANTATALAQTLASRSLNNNGSALANIAIKYGMGSATAEFVATDVAALRAIIDDLQGEGGVFEQLDTAYMQYILAYAASAATGTDETVWKAVQGAVTADGATLDTVVAAIGEANLPDEVKTALAKLNGAKTQVATADAALDTMETELGTDPSATFTWDEIKTAMTPLANPAAMTINGIPAGEVKEKLGDLVSSVTAQGGLTVIMATGAGVYADIADQCGDYTASITIERVEYNGIVLNNMNARMKTATTVNPLYLPAIGSAVERAGAPAQPAGTNVMPISEFYGYVIDLAFRTNASDSKLLLQTTPIDRIYSDNSNDATMGRGATMTFAATTTDFSNDQVKALMECIRIVFFNPDGNTILAYAKLDVANSTVGTDGVTADIRLYTVKEGVETMIPDEKDAVIMELTRATAHKVSTLVYLDGNSIENEDVAAAATTSMTGKMNLQFSSSATLVPMEYADLHTPQGEGTATTYDVTVPAGVTGAAKATANTAYTFTVQSGYTLGTVTVGGTEVEPTLADGTYTIPADKVTGVIVITATQTP